MDSSFFEPLRWDVVSRGSVDRRDAVDWSAADPCRLQTAFIGLQGMQTAACRIRLTVVERIVPISFLYHV